MGAVAGAARRPTEAQRIPFRDVIRFAAELIGVTPPVPVPFEEADLTPMARTFYISRRRVRSVVREPELGIDLLYPNYRSGLRAILNAEEKL